MEQDGQVNIALKITAENGGVQKVERGLNRVENAAKKTASESKGGFARMQQGVGKVTGAIGALRNVITGFGIVGLIMPVIQIFKSWHDEIRRTGERAKALREELALKAAAAEVKAVADSYRDLNEAVKAVADSRQRDNELFSEEVRLRREAEDAASAAAEADALAGVDPNAVDADRQRDQIRSRFAANRARTTADRKRADVVFRRQNLNRQAEDATAAADLLEASLAGDDKAILRARIRANTLDALSRERNDRDGTWYNPHRRTEEGDAERDRLRREADTARAETKRLEEDKKAKEKQIADLRASATHAGRLAGVLYQGISTAETERATATVVEGTDNAATAAKHAAEQKKIADANAAKALLSRQQADLQARIKAEEDKKAAAGLSVFQAQGDYDLAVANGASKSMRTAAYRNLQSAMEKALEVDHASDTAINAMKETLDRVKDKFNEVKNVLERQSKQQANYQVEYPAGS